MKLAEVWWGPPPLSSSHPPLLWQGQHGPAAFRIFSKEPLASLYDIVRVPSDIVPVPYDVVPMPHDIVPVPIDLVPVPWYSASTLPGMEMKHFCLSETTAFSVGQQMFIMELSIQTAHSSQSHNPTKSWVSTHISMQSCFAQQATKLILRSPGCTCTASTPTWAYLISTWINKLLRHKAYRQTNGVFPSNS